MEFAVSRTASVRLSVLDLQGRELIALASGSYAPGRYRVSWDTRTDHGTPVAAGLYFVRYQTPGKTVITRFAVTR
jgi:hypothetical protein